jgi:hypothetical protein
MGCAAVVEPLLEPALAGAAAAAPVVANRYGSCVAGLSLLAAAVVVAAATVAAALLVAPLAEAMGEAVIP